MLKINQKNEMLSLFLISFIALWALLWGATLFINIDLEFYASVGKAVTTGGQVLYKDIGDIKPPLVFYVLAFFMLPFRHFPYEGMRLICFFLIIVQALLIFTFLRKIEEKENMPTHYFFKSPAFLTTVTFILVRGSFYNLYINLCPLLANIFFTIFLYFFFCVFFPKVDTTKKKQNSTLFLSGLFLGIAFVTSSVLILYTLLFPIFYFLFIPKNERTVKYFKKFGLISFSGFIIPALLFFIYFACNNALFDVYYWNYIVPLKSGYRPIEGTIYNHIANFTHTKIIADLFFLLITPVAALPTTGILGLVTYYTLYKKGREKKFSPVFIFLFCFMFLSLCVRLILKENINATRYTDYLFPFLIFGTFYFFKDYYKKLSNSLAKPLLIVFALTLFIGMYYYDNVFLPHKKGILIQNKKNGNKEIATILSKNLKKNDTLYSYSYFPQEILNTYSNLKYYNIPKHIYALEYTGFCPKGTFNCERQADKPNNFTFRQWQKMLYSLTHFPPRAVVDYTFTLDSFANLHNVEKVQSNEVYNSGEMEKRVKRDIFYIWGNFIHHHYKKITTPVADIFIYIPNNEI